MYMYKNKKKNIPRAQDAPVHRPSSVIPIHPGVAAAVQSAKELPPPHVCK